jgi:hypothetical protein
MRGEGAQNRGAAQVNLADFFGHSLEQLARRRRQGAGQGFAAQGIAVLPVAAQDLIDPVRFAVAAEAGGGFLHQLASDEEKGFIRFGIGKADFAEE